MKKLIASIVFIVILLAGLEIGSASYVGQIVDDNFQNMVSLSKKGPNLSVQVLSYERGYFQSEAVTNVTIFGQTFNVQHTIYHGPIIYSGSTDNSASPFHFQLGMVESRVLNPPDGLSISWNTYFPYLGGAVIESKGSPFQLKRDNLMITGKGWHVLGNIDSNWQNFHVEKILPDLKITNAMQNLSTESINTQAVPGTQAGTGSQGMPLQNMNLELQDVKLITDYQQNTDDKKISLSYSLGGVVNQNMKIELDGFLWEGKWVFRAKDFDMAFQGKLDKLSKVGTQYGPFQIHLSIENLDNAALDYMANQNVPTNPAESVASMSSLNSLNPTNPASDSESQTMATTIDSRIKEILTRRMTIKLENSSFKIPEGEASIDFWVRIGNFAVKKAQSSFDLKDVIMKTSEGSLHSVITKGLFQEMLREYFGYSLSSDPQYNSLNQADKDQRINTEVNNLIENLKKIMVLKENNNYDINFSFKDGNWMGHKVETQNPVSSPTAPTTSKTNP